MKLHLPARVPTEGSRMLAQWVLGLPCGLATAAEVMKTDAERVQRMVAGEMVPGLEVGTILFRFTGIQFRDFHRPAACGWFEQPATLARAA